ncbi:MAG: hypothetical protein ACMUIP_05780 [bacterium]
MKVVNKYKIFFVFILFLFFVSLIFTGTSWALDPWFFGYSNFPIYGPSNLFSWPQANTSPIYPVQNAFWGRAPYGVSNSVPISWGPISVQNNIYSRPYTTPGGGGGVSYGPAYGHPSGIVEDEVAFFDKIAFLAANSDPATFYAAGAAGLRAGMKTITKDNNGETITLQVGDKIEIVLPVINDREWREKEFAENSGVINEVYTPVDMNADVITMTPLINPLGIEIFLQTNTYREQKEIPVKTYEAKGQEEYELVLECFSRSNPDVVLDTFSILIKVE